MMKNLIITLKYLEYGSLLLNMVLLIKLLNIKPKKYKYYRL